MCHSRLLKDNSEIKDNDTVKERDVGTLITQPFETRKGGPMDPQLSKSLNKLKWAFKSAWTFQIYISKKYFNNLSSYKHARRLGHISFKRCNP